jgi:hypothetical protein
MTDKLQARYQVEFDKLGSLTEAQRAARTQELNRQFLVDWSSGAKSLMDSRQMSRYQQLQLQYSRFNSFTDPAVQKQLNLTTDQQARLREANAWSEDQIRSILQTGATDRDRGLRMYDTFNQAYQERLNGILSRDQQQVWQGVIGEPFAFQPQFPSTPTGGGAAGTTTPPKR